LYAKPNEKKTECYVRLPDFEPGTPLGADGHLYLIIYLVQGKTPSERSECRWHRLEFSSADQL